MGLQESETVIMKGTALSFLERVDTGLSNLCASMALMRLHLSNSLILNPLSSHDSFLWGFGVIDFWNSFYGSMAIVA